MPTNKSLIQALRRFKEGQCESPHGSSKKHLGAKDKEAVVTSVKPKEQVIHELKGPRF